MKLFSEGVPTSHASTVLRRTATVVTASVALSLAGGPLPRVWAQTPPPNPGAATTAKPPEAHEPTPDEVEAAKQHFDAGVEFFQRGNYYAARAEFVAAYALTKYPQLLFNLGKTAEKLGQPADAIQYLEQYLAASPSAADGDEVRAKLAELGHAPSPSKTAAPGARSGPPIPAIALLGAGAGLLIIGIGLGVGALSDANTVKSAGSPGGSMMYTKSVADALSQGPVLNGTGIALDVLGGLSLAAGGAWTGYWLYQRRKAASAAKPPAVSFIPTPMRLGAGIAGVF